MGAEVNVPLEYLQVDPDAQTVGPVQYNPNQVDFISVNVNQQQWSTNLRIGL